MVKTCTQVQRGERERERENVRDISQRNVSERDRRRHFGNMLHMRPTHPPFNQM